MSASAKVGRKCQYSNGKRSKPIQSHAAEPSPLKSHRRPNVAASRGWLESLPLQPQVDVWITYLNEEDEFSIRRSGLSGKDDEVTFDCLVHLIKGRGCRKAYINKVSASAARAMRRVTVPINSPGANGLPRCGRLQNKGGNASRP
jgi:hypothetical protein